MSPGVRHVALAMVGLVAVLAGGCGGHGAEKYAGPPSEAEQAYGACAACHADVAVPMLANGGHGSVDLKCPSCHADVEPNGVGCGHRGITRCADCHPQNKPHHDPNAGTPLQCTLCHTPHGSPNIRLIRAQLATVSPENTVTACTGDGQCGADQLCASTNESCGSASQTGGCGVPITFTNRMGKADGSFASVSAPGTGVCEVCHTTTLHYRSNGTGTPHFTLACPDCHLHTRAFAPPGG